MSILDFIKNELKISKKDLYAIPYWDRVRLSKMFIQPDDTGSSPKGTLKINNEGRSRSLIIRLEFVYRKYMKYEMVLLMDNKYDRNGHISARGYYIHFLRNARGCYIDFLRNLSFTFKKLKERK